jgi:hypothetical protein
MRKLVLILILGAAAVAVVPAHAQMSDAERAAARQEDTAAPPPPAHVAAPSPPAGASPRKLEHHSWLGFVFGGHLGVAVPAGTIPVSPAAACDWSSGPCSGIAPTSDISGVGFDHGLDASFRFARRLLVGLTLEHALFGTGNHPGRLTTAATGAGTQPPKSVRSDTTLLAVVFSVLIDPDDATLYFEAGVGNRWYGFSATNADGSAGLAHSYTGAEGFVGLGFWIPVGGYLRLLPKVSLSRGNFSFNAPDCTGTPQGCASSEHSFVLFNLAGFYNLDL